jgi:hypothetical protein
MQGEKLTRKQSEYLWENSKCPDCHGDLLAGPRGGCSINVKCEKCGHEFNVPPRGTFLVERIGGPMIKMALLGAIVASTIEIPDEVKSLVDDVVGAMAKKDGMAVFRG